MQICLVYDCLYPYTVGGAERWYRNLARRLVDDGHDLTYLTLRQWPDGEEADLPGARVVAVGPALELYHEARRRTLPPLVFGAGVFRHLLEAGRRYDVVHTASFPYFSLLAAGALRRRSGYLLVVDWLEVWSRSYWREYLGPLGDAGWRVQRLCARVPQRAFCFSRLHAKRLREEGYRGRPTVIRGLYEGSLDPPPVVPPEPFIVYAGRHIAEKRVPAVVAALAAARREAPELRAVVYGDGPDRGNVVRTIREHGLDGAVEAPGFVPQDRIEDALGRATCLVLASRREGYGLVVVEAMARGTPAVVVEGPDNAAVELVVEGVNGAVARSASPSDLAAAILRVRAGGTALRRSTADWFGRNAAELSVERSMETVAAAYGAGR